MQEVKLERTELERSQERGIWDRWGVPAGYATGSGRWMAIFRASAKKHLRTYGTRGVAKSVCCYCQ